MALQQTRDIEQTRFLCTTVGELARWRQARGSKVLEKSGAYWVETAKGFYQGIHWMARMSMAQVSCPTSLCWGYRTTLDDRSAVFSNATMPVHLMLDVNSYDSKSLSSRQRNKLKNCFKQVEVVEVTGPKPLIDQGYPVYSSAVQRTGYGSKLSLQQYCKGILNFFEMRQGIVVAGLVEGRIAGYITAYSVGSTAYIEDVCLHTEFLKTNLSLGLFYVTAQACRKSGHLKELVHGLHTPENESLCKHKKGLGFSVVQIPSRVWFLPPTKSLVRVMKPDAYYRLTGLHHANGDGHFKEADHQRLRGQNNEVQSNT